MKKRCEAKGTPSSSAAGKDVKIFSSASTSSMSSSSSFVEQSQEKMAMALPEYGQSLWWIIWERDTLSASSLVKTLYVIATVLSLTVLLVLPDKGVQLGLAKGDFDDLYGIDSMSKLLQHPKALGLSAGAVQWILVITIGIYVLGLIIADLVLEWWKQSSSNTNNKDSISWPYPKSWDTDNLLCYDEMFSEPTRYQRLLRRPGNTLSNFTYLLASLCIFCSTMFSQSHSNNPFRLADFEFAFMLLLLTIFSTIWHGSNAPWSQYVDLWSMECCIFYLIVRYLCFGSLYLLLNSNQAVVVNNNEIVKAIAGAACAVAYTCLIVMLAKFYWTTFQHGWLHGPCPYSARARVAKRSNVFMQGHQDIGIGAVCAYAALPVVYAAIPTIILVGLIGSVGSLIACNVTFRTLVIGWSYRMFDRWTLDGNVLINYIVLGTNNNKKDDDKPQTQLSIFQILGAAVCSPTAVLHALTGITLLAGYVHVRSVDSEVLI